MTPRRLARRLVALLADLILGEHDDTPGPVYGTAPARRAP